MRPRPSLKTRPGEIDEIGSRRNRVRSCNRTPQFLQRPRVGDSRGAEHTLLTPCCVHWDSQDNAGASSLVISVAKEGNV
jgi:hypothetical protein